MLIVLFEFFSRSFQICTVSLITQVSLYTLSSATETDFSLMRKSSAFRLMSIFVFGSVRRGYYASSGVSQNLTIIILITTAISDSVM